MKFATITDRYGVVENQDSRFKLAAIRSDETKRGFTERRIGFIAHRESRDRGPVVCLHAATNFPVSTTCTSVKSKNAAASGQAPRSRSRGHRPLQAR